MSETQTVERYQHWDSCPHCRQPVHPQPFLGKIVIVCPWQPCRRKFLMTTDGVTWTTSNVRSAPFVNGGTEH